MASVKAKLKVDKILSNEEHPIVIQIILKRVRKVYYLGYSATKQQWDFVKGLPNSLHPERKIIKSRIENELLTLKGIIAKFENLRKSYTFDDIDKDYKSKGSETSFEQFCNSLVEDLKQQGKFGNSIVYKSTLESFKDFSNGKVYLISEINYDLVSKYQDYLLKKTTTLKNKETIKRLTPNGISFYLRTLRAIINKAIKAGLIEKSAYPFNDISIKSEKTRKRAVNKDIIKMVEQLDTSNENNLQLYKDIFLFSFYNRGMNFVDIAFLRVKNIEGGRIIYKRQKTGQQFSIKVTDKSKAIIAMYNDLSSPESFIFPIITREDKKYLDYRNAMRLMNKKLKRISELLKLDAPLTTYVARHSWATIAKRSGISTSVISEGLGHSTEETTQVYLDSFENDTLDEANEKIINL